METKGHSEEYFGDFRDFWYNRDFLELIFVLARQPRNLSARFFFAERHVGIFRVAAAGHDTGNGLADRLKAHVAATLAPGRVPHGVIFLDALPKTASQKIQRFRLSDMVPAQAAQ